jgi:hypothetical protein
MLLASGSVAAVGALLDMFLASTALMAQPITFLGVEADTPAAGLPFGEGIDR